MITRPSKIFIVFLLFAAICFAFYWLILVKNPVRFSEPYKKLSENNKRQAHILALEEKFNAVEAKNAVTEKELSLLEHALEIQQQINKDYAYINTESLNKEKKLQQRLHEYRAKPLYQESNSLEIKGHLHLEKESIKMALPLFKRAYFLQKEINNNYTSSSYYSLQKEVELRALIFQAKEKPIFDKSLQLEKQANVAINNEEWIVAYEALQQAIILQKELNEKKSLSYYKNIERLQKLLNKHISIQAGYSHLKIQNYISAARDKEAEKNYTAAAALFQQALELQEKINQIFPTSRFSSAQKVQEWEIIRQSLASFSPFNQIKKDTYALDTLLSEGKMNKVVNEISELLQALENVHRSFPQSQAFDEKLEEKLIYLNFMKADIAFIQKQVLPRLKTLPESIDWLVYRSETPEALYRKVMGDSPNKNNDRPFPVSSIAWDKAKEFCERLGWILGRETRLLTRKEFETIVDNPGLEQVNKTSWHVENSTNQMHKIERKQPNPSGLYDTLGNLAEWIDSKDEEKEDKVFAIGGNYTHTALQLQSIPLERLAKDTCSSLIGFRFMVSTNPKTKDE